jgi:hypothetical protein
MVGHTPDFYNAIVLGIDAENAKASAYIKHGPSLGTAREIILRDVMRDATPEPFRFATGFMHDLASQWVGGIARNVETVSKQCDVLVYDPTADPPKYAFENFVILGPGAARVAVEVKSDLDREKFDHSVDVAASTAQFRVPTFVFAYESVTFETMVEYFRCAVTNHQSHELPACVAAHKRNYVACRPSLVDGQPPFILLLDYSAGPQPQSWFATAMFLQFYDTWLRHRHAMDTPWIYHWFNSQVDLPNTARKYIHPAGVVGEGKVPVERRTS